MTKNKNTKQLIIHIVYYKSFRFRAALSQAECGNIKNYANWNHAKMLMLSNEYLR